MTSQEIEQLRKLNREQIKADILTWDNLEQNFWRFFFWFYVRKYDADVIYENHKTGNVYQLGNVEICSAIEYGYGGKKLTIDDLTDKSDAFSQISTNFGSWSCINGVLEVKGKDNKGRKGDYTLTLT